MKTIALSDGERAPVLGQGTWRMGENSRAHKDEVAALRLGIELGMTLAERYPHTPSARQITLTQKSAKAYNRATCRRKDTPK
jgi:hypothetical protein